MVARLRKAYRRECEGVYPRVVNLGPIALPMVEKSFWRGFWVGSGIVVRLFGVAHPEIAPTAHVVSINFLCSMLLITIRRLIPFKRVSFNFAPAAAEFSVPSGSCGMNAGLLEL